MAKIAKSATHNVVAIGGSDYPLDFFRARYEPSHVVLIPKDASFLEAPKLKFRYADIRNGSDVAVGTNEAAVRPYLQEQLNSVAYVAPEPAE